MSWASENPEAYQALERSAVVRWLEKQWQVMYFDLRVDRAVEEEFLPDLVELLQAEQPKVFQAMLDAGADQLIDFSEHEAFVPIMPKDGEMADMLVHVEGVIGMPIQFVPGD